VLQNEAIRRLPGMDDAEWGAPLPSMRMHARR